MQLSFAPALGSVTSVSLPVGTDGTVVFKAAFPSLEAYEEAQKAGVRVEVWTNLPVHPDEQEWGALAFQHVTPSPRSERASEKSTLAGEGWHLSLQVPFARRNSHATSFSCTYRLVYPFRETVWLGEYGQDATLIFENKHPRIDLHEGWSLPEDGRAHFDLPSNSDLPVGQLDTQVKWTAWAIGQHGRVTFQPHPREIDPCHRIILFPQWQVDDVASTQPLLLVSEQGSSVRLSPTGQIRCKAGERGGSLHIYAFNASFVDLLLDGANAHPGLMLSVLNHEAQSRWAMLACRRSADIYPIHLAIIPLQGLAEGDQSAVLSLPLDALSEMLAGEMLSDMVAFNSARNDAHYISIGKDQALHCHVGPYGAQITLANVYLLQKGSIRLSLLSTHEQSSCRLLEEVEGSLPTPPPSPPMHTASVTSTIISEHDQDSEYPPLGKLAAVQSDIAQTSSSDSSSQRTTSPATTRHDSTPRRRSSLDLIRRTQVTRVSHSYRRLFLSTLVWLFRIFFRRFVLPWLMLMAPPIARVIKRGAPRSTVDGATRVPGRQEPAVTVRDYPIYRSTRVKVSQALELLSSSASFISSPTSPSEPSIVVIPEPDPAALVYRTRTSTMFVAQVCDMQGSLVMLVQASAPSSAPSLTFRLNGEPLLPPRVSQLEGTDSFLVELNTHAGDGLLEVTHHV